MRDFSARGPSEALTGVRGKVKSQLLAAHVEAGEHRGRAGEAVAHRPVFAAEVRVQIPAVFRAALEGAGDLGEDAAFLRVPAKHGDEVDRFAAQVVELRVDFLKRKTLKEEEQRFQFAVAEAVQLMAAKDDVEVAVAARVEVEVVLRKDAQAANALVC